VGNNHRETPDAADPPGRDNTVIGKYGSGITFSVRPWERGSLAKSSWDGEDLSLVKLLGKVCRYYLCDLGCGY